jgi:toxin YoeB
MNITFTADAWEHYQYWQGNDKEILQRLNTLIKDCQRSAFKGFSCKCNSLKKGIK